MKAFILLIKGWSFIGCLEAETTSWSEIIKCFCSDVARSNNTICGLTMMIFNLKFFGWKLFIFDIVFKLCSYSTIHWNFIDTSCLLHHLWHRCIWILCEFERSIWAFILTPLLIFYWWFWWVIFCIRLMNGFPFLHLNCFYYYLLIFISNHTIITIRMIENKTLEKVISKLKHFTENINFLKIET